MLAVIALLSCSGCATAYMADRGRDAADIFTATVGLGAGGNARVGPVQAGLCYSFDQAGLRGGRLQKMPHDPYAPIPYVSQANFLLLSIESFSTHAKGEKGGRRGKSYFAGGALCFTVAETLPYYTQIEVVAGLGPTVRLGFNPGELVDFVLGWTTLDLFGDDLGRRRKAKEKAKESKEDE